jgi:hypothetical protein
MIPWFRSHASAILGTVLAASNLHLLPSVAGKIAAAIAAACGY